MTTNGLQKVFGGIIYQVVRTNDDITSLYRHYEQIVPQKYLKFWDEDYPYLRSRPDSRNRCLPVVGEPTTLSRKSIPTFG